MHSLDAPYTREEVCVALFQMDPWKALGVDGFSVMFFQDCWDIIQDDFLKVSLEFLNDGLWDAANNITPHPFDPRI